MQRRSIAHTVDGQFAETRRASVSSSSSLIASRSRRDQGNWGCGIFGGTDAHKFVQQVLVAAHRSSACSVCVRHRPGACNPALGVACSETTLLFSAQGERGDRMRRLLDAMAGRQVGALSRLMSAFVPSRQLSPRQFGDWFIESIAAAEKTPENDMQRVV